MSKGPRISHRVEAFIAEVSLQNPTWNSRQVHEKVLFVVQNRKTRTKVPDDWPGRATVQRVLKRMRNHPPSPQEEPWSIAAACSSPVDPIVFIVWKVRHDHGKILTMRDAKWLANLQKIPGIDEGTWLFEAAESYSRLELAYELVGHPFNSGTFDEFYFLRANAKVKTP